MEHLESTFGVDQEAWAREAARVSVILHTCPCCGKQNAAIRRCGRLLTVCCNMPVEGRELS